MFRIAVETTTGCLLGASALGKRGVTSYDVAKQAADNLLTDLSYQSCVDQHLQDQVETLSCRRYCMNSGFFYLSS